MRKLDVDSKMKLAASDRLTIEMIAPDHRKKIETISFDKILLLEEFSSMLPEANEDKQQRFMEAFQNAKVNQD